MRTNRPKHQILVFTNNHFDPTWRRCWNKRLTFEGKSYVSYAELQEYYLLDNLELSRRIPGYKFEAECTMVLRNFLERHPEKTADFAKLSKEGRFAVSGAGDNIIDSNMVLGESIVRNFLYGLLWVEDTLGAKTSMGVRNDAFGNSTQIPQIFRGCEIKWVTGFSYSDPHGAYFRGLDGSTVATVSLPCAGSAEGAAKYPPCENCKGKGCPTCHGRGIMKFRAKPPESLNFKDDAPVYCVKFTPEELLPCMEIGDWAARMRKKHDIVFSLGEDAFKFLKSKLEKVDNPSEKAVHPGVELNPNNTGCYVTRIKLKQECRRLEYAALGVETLLSTTRLKGLQYPKKEMESVWRKLLFTMFHDAITGTHIDAAYEEIMDINSEIAQALDKLKNHAISKLVEKDSGKLSVINPRGCEFTGVVSAVLKYSGGNGISLVDEKGKPVEILETSTIGDGRMSVRFLASEVEPFSSKIYRLVGGKSRKACRRISKPVIENSRFRITADEGGILSIYDKKLKTEISKAGDYRPCEPILESDEGSPWATLKNSCIRDRVTTHKLKSIESEPGWQALSFEVGFGGRTCTGGHPFLADIKVVLTEGLERIDFEVECSRWEAFNARIRFVMPVPFGGEDFYEVPYASLNRKPYKPFFNWIGANGDWPAINWAGVQGKAVSVALFNKGIPSYKMENDGKGGKTMLLSVLRSPVIPTYLHEPWDYVMTDFWGMRDAGKHRFEFALSAYDGDFASSTVVDDAESYNAGAISVSGEARLPEMPSIESQCARISAVKASEKGDALILRVVESRGCGGEAILKVPAPFKAVSKVNLMERDGKRLERDMTGSVKLKLHPWEIATIRCELG